MEHTLFQLEFSKCFQKMANKVNSADCQKRHLFCIRKNAPLLSTADSRRYVLGGRASNCTCSLNWEYTILKITVEESVVISMDGTSKDLFPYLPYILQDLWEIGTPTKVVIELIEKHTTDYSNQKILDLGCGKGAVSIKLAKKLNCHCHGIDAIKEFIVDAKNKAKEFKVGKCCYFECDDIRSRIYDLREYDIVILGATDTILGDFYSTLSKVSKCIKSKGLILIDICYIDGYSEFSDPSIERKSAILEQLSNANIGLIDEITTSKEDIEKSGKYIYNNINRRCQELINKYPRKKDLFIDYIHKQELENEILETKIICSTMLLKKVL